MSRKNQRIRSNIWQPLSSIVPPPESSGSANHPSRAQPSLPIEARKNSKSPMEPEVTSSRAIPHSLKKPDVCAHLQGDSVLVRFSHDASGLLRRPRQWFLADDMLALLYSCDCEWSVELVR